MDHTLDAAVDCDEMIDSIVGREQSAGAGTSDLSASRALATRYVLGPGRDDRDSVATSYWLLILNL